MQTWSFWRTWAEYLKDGPPVYWAPVARWLREQMKLQREAAGTTEAAGITEAAEGSRRNE